MDPRSIAQADEIGMMDAHRIVEGFRLGERSVRLSELNDRNHFASGIGIQSDDMADTSNRFIWEFMEDKGADGAFAEFHGAMS